MCAGSAIQIGVRCEGPKFPDCVFFFSLFSPDVALPSVSAYDNEDQMLTFVQSQLKEIAKRKGIQKS